ncbi:MAG: ABC transporter permease subunit [Verrucomicrobiota bacterium]
MLNADPRLRLLSGQGIFLGLNKVVALAVWAVVPLLVADGLARERRQGTLGLLFLTPLTARQIVTGKACSQALRALTLIVAAYPVLTIPVLLGGVGWPDVARLLLIQLAVLALALASGLLASAAARDALPARLLAFTLTVAASLVFAVLYVGAFTLWQHARPAGPGPPDLPVAFQRNFQQWILRQLWFGRGLGLFWRSGAGGPGWVGLLQAAAVLAAALGLAAAAVGLAGRVLAFSWAREVAGLPAPAWWEALRRERPLPWPPARRPPAQPDPARRWFALRGPERAASWVLGAAVGSFLAFSIPGAIPLVPNIAVGRVLFLLAAFLAAGSFRREREGGGWELLLVTPLAPAALLRARLRALLQFLLPAVLAYLVLAGWGDHQLATRDPGIRALGLSAGQQVALVYLTWPLHLLTVLVVGLRLALARLPFAAAWPATAALTVGFRMVFTGVFQFWIHGWLGPGLDTWPAALTLTVLADTALQVALGVAAWRGTRRILDARAFRHPPRAAG